MKYPIGIQDFEDLQRNGYAYVDKTNFVYKLADEPPLYIAGEWAKDDFEHYHNFYAVFEQNMA